MRLIEDFSSAAKLLYKGFWYSVENTTIEYEIQGEKIGLDLSQIEKKTWFYNSTPDLLISLSNILGLNLTIHPSGNISVRNLTASGDHSDYYIVSAEGKENIYFFCLSIEETTQTLYEIRLYKVIYVRT